MRTTLRSDEKVLLTAREHWLILLGPAFLAALGIAGTAITVLKYPRYQYIAMGIAILLVLHFVWKIYNRHTNIWVVTSLRVIDEYGVLSSHSIESPLDKINNVEYDQSVWGRLFGYGNVTLQTAAEMGATTYYFLARPKLLQTTVFNAQGGFRDSVIRQKSQSLAGAIRNNEAVAATPSFEEEIERLYQLKTKGILSEEEYNKRKQKLMDS